MALDQYTQDCGRLDVVTARIRVATEKARAIQEELTELDREQRRLSARIQVEIDSFLQRMTARYGKTEPCRCHVTDGQVAEAAFHAAVQDFELGEDSDLEAVRTWQRHDSASRAVK